jgi:glycosyltransferase involved in cell wall biosynthesis
MISVCIPTYNGEAYIKDQIESIIVQLSENDEIIISDDNSIDDTIDIIKSFGDNRIHIYTHKKITNPYKGTYKNIYCVSMNIENALKHAKGDYIFLADQDDIWLPNKVEYILSVLNNRSIKLILHDNIVIDNNGQIMSKSYFEIYKPSNKFFNLIFRCAYQGCCMAFTKDIKEIAIPFPKNPISHDHWIAFCAIFSKKEIEIIRYPLILYRRHGNNVSPSAEKRSPNSLFFKISYRLLLLYAWLIIIFKRK